MRRLVLIAAMATVAFGQNQGIEQTDTAAIKGIHKEKAVRRAQEAIRKAVHARLSAPDVSITAGPISVVIRQPSQWTLTTKTCPSLKSDLSGTGEDKTTVSISPNPDGTYLIEAIDEVTGTASDAGGNSYVFLYTNVSTIDSYPTLTLQEPVPPFVFHGPDTFQLLGSSSPGYTVAQYFRLQVNADGSVNDMGSGASANPNCDPI